MEDYSGNTELSRTEHGYIGLNMNIQDYIELFMTIKKDYIGLYRTIQH